MGHLAMSACNLARLGPPLPFFFIFPLSTWITALAGPTLHHMAQEYSRPFYRLNFKKVAVNLCKNQRQSNENNSRYTNPNPVKPSYLVQKFNYLSNATGPIFLGFYYDL
jgi:hypothetical protein